MTGFTGVRWETRQAERLSRDLTTGAGPKPLFEAGLAWATIAGSLKELDVDLAHLRKAVIEGWSGSAVSSVVAALDSLTKWVADTTEMARRNAEAAERQAIAHTVAVAAMPDAAIIAGVGQLEAALKMVAAPPASLIAGGIAKLDEQAVGMKAQASRVMESYEHATTPVSKPAHPPAAPVDVADNRAAAQARASAEAKLTDQNGQAIAAAQNALLAFSAMSGTNGRVRASDQYVSQTKRADVVQGVAGEEVAVERTTVASTGSAPAPFLPAAPMAQASHSDTSGAHIVAAPNYDSVQDVVLTGTTAAAPSVIGAVEQEGA